MSSCASLNGNLISPGDDTRENSDYEMIDYLPTSSLRVPSLVSDEDVVQYGRLSNLSIRSRKISCRQCGSMSHDAKSCEVSLPATFYCVDFLDLKESVKRILKQAIINALERYKSK